MTSDPAARAKPTRELLRALPKVELHVHIEGSFAPERVARLASEAGVALLRPLPDLYDCADLDELLALLDWACALVRTEEQVEQVAYDLAARTARDGTVYAEVIVNPTHWPAWPFTELVSLLAAGFDRAARDGLTDCRLLPSILRSQPADEALELARWIATGPPRVVGISIDGNEARSGRVSARFVDAYAVVGAAGLGRTVHAGESSGPEGVLDALDVLDADRIDHGVRVVEDADALRRVVDAGVPFDVCLTSNVVTLYPSLDEHPLRALAGAGATFTINTDDPALLGCDLVGELDLAAAHLDWDVADAIASQRRAIDAAFASASERAALHRRLDEFVASEASRSA